MDEVAVERARLVDAQRAVLHGRSVAQEGDRHTGAGRAAQDAVRPPGLSQWERAGLMWDRAVKANHFPAYADQAHPINSWRTTRAPVDEIATFFS